MSLWLCAAWPAGGRSGSEHARQVLERDRGGALEGSRVGPVWRRGLLQGTEQAGGGRVLVTIPIKTILFKYQNKKNAAAPLHPVIQVKFISTKSCCKLKSQICNTAVGC